MKIRTMNIEDIPTLHLQSPWMAERYADYVRRNAGPSWVVEDEKGPVCAFGLLFWWPGVAESWFNLIHKRNTFKVLRICHRYLKEQTKKHNLNRIQAYVACPFVSGQKFIESFGFQKQEGKLEGFSPDGTDVYLYSRMTCKH